MKQRPRIYYSESQKALMWERWRKGDTLHQIARLFNRNHSSVQGILAQTGGIQPAARRRSSFALTLAEPSHAQRMNKPAANGEVAGFSRERLARIAPVMKEQIAKATFPGAVTLIGRRGRLVHFESHGFLDAALSVGVVLNVTFDRVYALVLFELVWGDAGHRGSFGTADERIAREVGVGWLSGLLMFRC